MQLIKPQKLNKGDTVALISPSWGCAGAPRVKWKYKLGCERLEEIGLNVISAPNALRGETFLHQNPEARAYDVVWAFSKPDVKAVICNIGGNDSERLLKYIDPEVIINNPKIFCGYSDAMSLHLYFNQLGLMTYYGDNLLTAIAEQSGWHSYSKAAFLKAFFDDSVIGKILPSDEVSYSENNHTDRTYEKKYIKHPGYKVIQGTGTVCGKLIGGHGGIVEYGKDSLIKLTADDFKNRILFFEDIEKVCDYEYLHRFFRQLGQKGWLQLLNGIIIGQIKIGENFKQLSESVKNVISGEYNLTDMPVIYGLNIGHISPITIIPYGAEARISIDDDYIRFEITESIVC